MTSARTAATAAALTATLGLAAASWVVAVRQMSGMDMGVATGLGSFAFFAALWVSMMAAMMLPGAAPAVLRRAHGQRPGARRAAVCRVLPCGLDTGGRGGVCVVPAARVFRRRRGGDRGRCLRVHAAQRHFRRRCRESVGSGLGFGLCCVGSSIGLMGMLVALGVMSVTWMSVIAVVVLGQKLLPANAAIDVPVALAIVGLGVVIVVAPWSVPGLTPAM
jgi:predicted metal-binding membrane protein